MEPYISGTTHPVPGGEDDTAILVVSFGTSCNDSREATIGAIEEAVGRAFPRLSVRRAFTSQTIIDKLARRDGLRIDNVREALGCAATEGVRRLIVQPTHLMAGLEYTALVRELDRWGGAFEEIAVGEPLLTSDGDFEAVTAAVTAAGEAVGGTAVVFLGHGTEAESNAVYERLQGVLTGQGHTGCYIGTVEARPGLEDVIDALRGRGYTRVILEPLMVVAGDHANNDMAGDGADSWKNALAREGYEVECRIRGLGENEAIRQIYVAHAQAAAAKLRQGARDGV